MRAQLLDPARARLGEGPLWDARRELVHWVDIDGATWHRWSFEEGALPVVPLQQTPGFLALHADGSLLAGVATGFARLSDDGTLAMLALVEIRSDHRMNDGEVDPSGRVWGSTVARSCDRPTGSLWRLDLDGSAHEAISSVTVGNGIAFTEDGTSMWFVDSAARTLDRLTVDPATGHVSARRPVVRFDDDEEPDGLCMDADGGVWVAVWGGGSVRRYDTAGRETARIEVPAAHVTSCAFAGPQLDQLVITTARRDTDRSEAGGLFVAEPGVQGRSPSLARIASPAPRPR